MDYEEVDVSQWKETDFDTEIMPSSVHVTYDLKSALQKVSSSPILKIFAKVERHI